MHLDAQNLFSDKQAITVTAVSDNYINTGERVTAPRAPAPEKGDYGGTSDIPLLAQVTTTFEGGTSLVAELQTSDDPAFGTVKTVAATPAIPVADLVAGAQLAMPVLPRGMYQRYWRMNYVVDGTMTAGAVTAGISAGNQTNG